MSPTHLYGDRYTKDDQLQIGRDCLFLLSYQLPASLTHLEFRSHQLVNPFYKQTWTPNSRQQGRRRLKINFQKLCFLFMINSCFGERVHARYFARKINLSLSLWLPATVRSLEYHHISIPSFVTISLPHINKEITYKRLTDKLFLEPFWGPFKPTAYYLEFKVSKAALNTKGNNNVIALSLQ